MRSALPLHSCRKRVPTTRRIARRVRTRSPRRTSLVAIGRRADIAEADRTALVNRAGLRTPRTKMARCLGRNFPAESGLARRRKCVSAALHYRRPAVSSRELGSEGGILARGRTYNLHKLPEL